MPRTTRHSVKRSADDAAENDDDSHSQLQQTQSSEHPPPTKRRRKATVIGQQSTLASSLSPPSSHLSVIARVKHFAEGMLAAPEVFALASLNASATAALFSPSQTESLVQAQTSTRECLQELFTLGTFNLFLSLSPS